MKFETWAQITKIGIGGLGLIAGLSGCEMNEYTEEVLIDSFTPSVSDYSGNPPPLAPQCFVERYMQPDAVVTRKLDLLFVIDTSGSLDTERAAVADGIDAFVRELPADVNFRIGVMLAHGDTSSYSGRLYNASGRPKVLDSQTRTMTQIRSDLRANLTSVRTDSATDGGEAMLYSLTQGLKGQRLSDSKNLGFFREDAALAVVFVSDEQDICAEFPAGWTPVPDPQRSEAGAKARLCSGITPSSVHELVRSVKGDMPYLFSAVIYHDLATWIRHDENEIGFGMLELVQSTNGVLIDLANGEYSAGLSMAGRLATVKLDLLSDFTLARPNIEPATIQVWVDGAVKDFVYSANTNEVHVNDPGMARSIVDINYCLKTAPCVGVGCGGGVIGI